MEEVAEDLARWAVGPGLEVIGELTAALADGAEPLALGTRLREQLDPAQAAFATTAAATRLRAVAQGVEGAEQLVLTREALEQASHPAAAAWRAARAHATVGESGRRETVHDLCAGTGGDAAALAMHGPVLAVERDPGRAVLARHRAEVLRRPVTVRVGDALDADLDHAGVLVHADPDRRDAQGRRARHLAEHRPSVAGLLGATADAAGRLLTVAPGVGWDDRELPEDAEVVFLQHGGDLLEAVVCTGAARTPGVRATAVLLDRPSCMRSRAVGDRGRLAVTAPGAFLVAPAPALVRARLHDAVGAEVGATRLAEHRALLTAEVAPDSPWMEVEQVEAVLPARPDALRAHLRDHPERRVEVVLHGMRVDIPSWLRAAGRPATGPDDLRVHLVRRDDDAVAVLSTATA